MKSYIMVVLAVALFRAIVVAEDAGEGKEGSKGLVIKFDKLTCLGEPMDKEVRKKGLKECKGTDGEKNGKKNLCTIVCEWKQKGILNADGDYDSAGAATYLTSLITKTKSADPVIAAMASCGSKIGDKATRMDNDCAGYKKFKKCRLNEVLGKACGNEKLFKELREKNKKGKN